MIGEAKQAAVSQLLRRSGTRAEECYAYGDHSSDLGLLRAVGDPTVVGNDPVLLEQALAHGWQRLAATAGPLPVPERGPRAG
jgi:phosphoserine phosphatase